MPGWVGRNADRLRRMYPQMYERVLRRLDLPAWYVRLAIVLMGVLFLLAAADGARTAGRSVLFQVVLIGFGVHSLAHVGQAVLVRGYAPGVVTAVLVVAPFSIWAWLHVDTAGGAVAILGALVIAPAIIAVYALAYALGRAYRAVSTSQRGQRRD
jgi:hypothetical protein